MDSGVRYQNILLFVSISFLSTMVIKCNEHSPQFNADRQRNNDRLKFPFKIGIKMKWMPLSLERKADGQSDTTVTNVVPENSCNSVLKEKLRLQDGITFYYFVRSPCARRVWLTLLVKNINVNMVMIDLMRGEQRHPSYLAINPQGKVPAIRVHNHPSIPNCTLFESQAIVEWLEEQFPLSLPIYPSINSNFFDYLETKMWQYWELTLAEEVWPLSRQQVDGVLWRLLYSRGGFLEHGPPSSYSNDAFYKKKVISVYNGTYISKASARTSVRRILRGFVMLEKALAQQDSSFLIPGSNDITAADIAVYPRLCKAPQNGIMADSEDRKLFPHVLKYFERLRQHPAFKRFSNEDSAIWNSGTYPAFAPQYWIRFIPWSLIIWIGRFRSGVSNFERITQKSVSKDDIAEMFAMDLKAIPVTNISEASAILHHDPSNPMSVATKICLSLLGFRCETRVVDSIHLENQTDDYLKILPFGESPALQACGRVIFGPHIIVEVVHHIRNHFVKLKWKPSFNDEFASYLQLFDQDPTFDLALHWPEKPISRAIIRRWFGWCHTAFYYQIQPLYRHRVVIPRLHEELRRSGARTIGDLLYVKDRDVVDSFVESIIDEEGVAAYEHELEQRLQTVENELKTSNDLYLVDSKLTYADVFVAAIVVFSKLLGRNVNNSKLQEWLDRLMLNDQIKDHL